MSDSATQVWDKTLIYGILGYLLLLKSSLPSNDSEQLDLAVGILESVFGVSTSSVEDFKEHSYHPVSFSQIYDKGVEAMIPQTYKNTLEEVENNPKFEAFFNMVSEKGYYDGVDIDSLEYMTRHAKLIQKFKEKVNDNAPGSSSFLEKARGEREAQAEDKKSLGNAAISGKDYEGAVQHYTEALDLSSKGPNSHIYYCNRAAAYCHLNEYAEAVADCEAAVALQPDYVKAYSRLGLANFFLGNYGGAVNAYETAVDLEPDNEGSKKSLKQAKKKLDETRKVSTVPTSAGGGAAVKSSSGATAAGMPQLPDMSSVLNDPNFSGMMTNPLMKDAMDKVGGQAGLASLMKDPQMMAMAQKMMQNPAALQQAMSMLGGGAGGMPDMNALAGMMGGLGNAGAGAGKGAKKGAFKGFEEDA